MSGRAAQRQLPVLTGLVAATVVLFGAVAYLPVRPESFLPLAAAILVATPTLRYSSARMAVLAVVVAGMAVALVAFGRGLMQVLLPVVQLVAVGAVTDALAVVLVDLGRSEAREARISGRRRRLLSAALGLPRSGIAAAAQAATSTMRSLGFDAAAVVIGSDGEPSRFFEDIPESWSPADRQGGLVGRAITEGRMLVASDYQAFPGLRDHRPEIGSAVAVPIRFGGQVRGALGGARRERGELSPEQLEVAEVLADHLGVALDTEERARRVHELAARMGRLDGMRRAFVDQVSEDLRQPLTVVRGTGQTLAARGVELPAGERDRMLAGMVAHAHELAGRIAPLLDVSRMRDRADPDVRDVELDVLLTGVVDRTGAVVDSDVDGGVCVEVDRELLYHALELMLGTPRGGHSTLVSVRCEGSLVVLRPSVRTADRSRLVASLAARLLLLAGARSDVTLERIELQATGPWS